MEELAKRKSPRLQGFDYNRTGAYFITVCTQNRRCILSKIVGTVGDTRSVCNTNEKLAILMKEHK